jgi:hypothetical protein
LNREHLLTITKVFKIKISSDFEEDTSVPKMVEPGNIQYRQIIKSTCHWQMIVKLVTVYESVNGIRVLKQKSLVFGTRQTVQQVYGNCLSIRKPFTYL